MNQLPSPAAVALIAASLFVAGTAAADEIVYKSVLPDGTVAYSAEPPANASKVEEVPIETLSPEQRRAAESLRRAADKKSAAVDRSIAEREHRLNQADHAITRGIERLKATEKALRNGRAPQAGERIGVKGGHTRLSADYFKRLDRLEAAVKTARKNLDEAYVAREALR